MNIRFTALATMLAVLCFACNQGTEPSSSDLRLVDVQEVQLNAPPAPKQSPNLQEKNRANVAMDSAEEKVFDTEDYDHIVENNFLTVNQNPLSTFSIDVDEASYSNVRRFINEGRLPPAGAVRIEEMINYFDYDYTPPAADEPFAVYSEIGTCPWNPKHQLIHIGLKGKELPLTNLPPSNLVFLIDVSGSMDEPNKLPLVQQSLNLLTDELREKDKVAIVVYAGNAGLVLPSTSGANKTKIKEAIDELQAGGSTAGGEGIQLAYQIARENFIPNGNNRIILATDGDFNVGMSSDDELVRLIEKERNSGVSLSVLGFGMGNYKDGKMQQLADKGNGNHSYIDNLNEAKKVLVSEFGSTLFTIAKDVKIQVEFNPGKVQAYRLIGYENRLLAAEDFKDDAKDAGELGSGHTVTALYEMIPVGVQDEFTKAVDSLKYTSIKRRINNNTGEVMTIKLRYKEPTESTSKLMVHVVKEAKTPFENSSDNFRFSAAVAEFGLLLRNSKFKQGAQYSQVLALANSAKGKDTNGYREEFMQLINLVSSMAKK
jgi:Ca-activated chloride channel family protein